MSIFNRFVNAKVATEKSLKNLEKNKKKNNIYLEKMKKESNKFFRKIINEDLSKAIKNGSNKIIISELSIAEHYFLYTNHSHHPYEYHQIPITYLEIIKENLSNIMQDLESNGYIIDRTTRKYISEFYMGEKTISYTIYTILWGEHKND